MRKASGWLIPCMMLMDVAVMSSCSDGDISREMVDTLPTGIETFGDSTVRPGNDFFMSCNGGWYRRTTLPSVEGYPLDGLYLESFRNNLERQKTLDFPAITKFLADTSTIDRTEAEAKLLIKQNMTPFDSITTQHDAWVAIGKSMLMGYNLFFRLSLYSTNDKVYAYFWSPDNIEYAMLKASYFAASKGLRSPAFRFRRNRGISALDPTERKLLVPLRSVLTKAVGGDMMQVIAETIGIDMNDMTIWSEDKEYISWVASLSPSVVKSMLQSRVAMDAIYASRSSLDSISQALGSPLSLPVLTAYTQYSYMGYVYSYAYSKKYMTDLLVKKVSDMCEELRSVFSDRIGALDWMSDATKKNAQEKLAAISFIVGVPSQWFEDKLPVLSGKSWLEDVMQLRKNAFALKKFLVGQNPRTMLINAYLTEPDDDFVDFKYGTPQAFNAFFVVETNQVIIFPDNLLSPMYDESLSDVLLYGRLGSTLGHEMTHGFDTSGCQYDKNGVKSNWWTPEDSARFVAKQKTIIDSYNRLQVFPDIFDSLYDDGTLTLNENIADLGGMEIAYQAYMNKLKREGFAGKELEAQERKFYQVQASDFRMKYTHDGFLYYRSKQVHSPENTRVNGLVQNADRWYELFGVKPGDALYLAPEKRTKIW